MPRIHPDHAIATLADAQHGVINHAQAIAAGLSKRMIEHRIETGRWHRLARGVYLLAGADRGFLTNARAATLLTPAGAVSGRSAAGLHRLTGFSPCPIELTVQPPASTANPLARVRRRLHFRSTRVASIPVGTVAQTVVDLCQTKLALRSIELATDDALLDRRLHVSHLEDLAVLHTALATRGVARLRTIVEARAAGEPVAQSVLEPLLWRLVDHPDVPPAVRQFRLPWMVDGRPGFADLFIEQWGLLLEADGRRWHTRIAEFERDRRRDRMALIHGLVVIRFTWADLTGSFDEALAELLVIGKRRQTELHGR